MSAGVCWPSLQAAAMSHPLRHTPESVRFLADRTVGKLARWLRILGYDTLYWPQLTPVGLLAEGRRQGRVILSRNIRILQGRRVSPSSRSDETRRPWVKDAPACVFIRSDHFRQQLKQVVETLGLEVTSAVLNRCVACNQVLQVVSKAEVEARVPAYVWSTQSAFRRCPGCGRIYWPASHRDHILAELERLGLAAATETRAEH